MNLNIFGFSVVVSKQGKKKERYRSYLPRPVKYFFTFLFLEKNKVKKNLSHVRHMYEFDNIYNTRQIHFKCVCVLLLLEINVKIFRSRSIILKGERKVNV